MSLKTFSTPFTENLLGMLLISVNAGTGFTLTDPGTYTLSSIVDWYHATSDDQALEDMDAEVGGDEVTITITDTPVTWYCKIQHVGDQAPLVFRYDQPSPSATVGSDASGNIALGTNALAGLTDGHRNVAIGEGTMVGAAGANDNTCVGTSAGNGMVEGALKNVAIGANALLTLATGDENVAVGYRAGPDATGSNNTFLGAYSGDEVGNGHDNVFVGYKAGEGRGNVSNTFCIGPIAFTVDEGGNLLNISVRYADGSFKTITGLALA